MLRATQRLCNVAKYSAMYATEFEREAKFPVVLLAPTKPKSFAHLLFRFASEIDGKNFGEYRKQIRALPSSKPTNAGVKFTWDWMAATNNVAELGLVQRLFDELADAATGTTRGVLTFAKEPNAGDRKTAEDKFIADAKSVYPKLQNVAWDVEIDAGLIDGYTVQIGTLYWDESGRAKAAAEKASVATAPDYTKAPAAVFRPTPGVPANVLGSFYASLRDLDRLQA